MTKADSFRIKEIREDVAAVQSQVLQNVFDIKIVSQYFQTNRKWQKTGYPRFKKMKTV